MVRAESAERDTRTRNELWGLLFDLERTHRYYERLYSRFTTLYVWLRVIILLFLASGSAVLVIATLPLPASVSVVVMFFPAGAGVVLVGLTVWDFVAGYPRKAAIIQGICMHLSYLRTEAHQLWLHIDDPEPRYSESEVREQIYDMSQKWMELEHIARANDINVDHCLNMKTSMEARQVLTERYHVATT